VISILGQTDPCANYDTLPLLNYLDERQVHYKLPDGGFPVCDLFLTETWYRMEDNVIATTNEPCGTNTNWYTSGMLYIWLYQNVHVKDISIALINQSRKLFVQWTQLINILYRWEIYSLLRMSVFKS